MPGSHLPLAAGGNHVRLVAGATTAAGLNQILGNTTARQVGGHGIGPRLRQLRCAGAAGVAGDDEMHVVKIVAAEGPGDLRG